MPQAVVNGIGTAGIRNPAALDSDATAFITAATITNETQKTAVNDLVLDLKAAGLWTKMKALYPMVGGTAASHKWNLKDPRDLDAAFRLNFLGGWTHSSTGATPNGSNGYANTYLAPSSQLLSNSSSLFIYTPSTKNGTAGGSATTDFGSQNGSAARTNLQTSNLSFVFRINFAGGINSTAGAYAFYHAQRNGTEESVWADGASIVTRTTTPGTMPTVPLTLGATNNNGIISQYSTKTYSFAGVSEGLSNLESNLLYQIVEKFQAVLGRNVNESKQFYFNKNYSNEVNAFIFNGGITNATQISATNTLVNTLKTAGIWTKMKAVYPMVGGTATAHKFNLVNPVDTDAAFRLVFNGGWTHSSNGALPNGTTGYANTNLIPNTNLTSNNHSLSFYSRTNNTTTGMELACQSIQASSTQYGYMLLASYYNAGKSYFQQQCQNTLALEPAVTNTQGFYNGSRTASNMFKSFRNGVLNGTQTNTASAIGSYLPVNSIYLSAWNINVNGTISTSAYSNRECAFASIGDGLTDAEATTFYNAVQAFQTTLGRAV